MQTTLLGITVLCLVIPLRPAVAEPPASRAETRIAAGLNLTDGNRQTLQANASITSEREKSAVGSVRSGAEGNYGQSTVDGQDETTAKNARAFANAKRTVTERWFASLDSSLLHDGISRIDYRATVGPGVGAYLIRTEPARASAEVGVSYICEKVSERTDGYPAFRFTERFERRFSDGTRLWQSVDYLPKTDDLRDSLLNAELGSEAALHSRFSLRLVVQDQFDSRPGPGLRRNDVRIIAGLSATL